MGCCCSDEEPLLPLPSPKKYPYPANMTSYEARRFWDLYMMHSSQLNQTERDWLYSHQFNPVTGQVEPIGQKSDTTYQGVSSYDYASY